MATSITAEAVSPGPALAAHFGKPSPDLTQADDVTRADGAALMNELVGDVFVRLRG